MENFKTLYEALVARAKSENRTKDSGCYYEEHHVLPRSLGGRDTKENLVLLTPDEHYMAHYYLWRFTNTPEMTSAFWFMSIHTSDGVTSRITPEEYAELREQAAKVAADRQAKPVYCLELDREFPSCREACKFVTGSGYGSENIGMCCNGHISAAFEWKDGLRYHWCWPQDKEDMIAKKEQLLWEEAHRKEITNKHISEAKMGSIPWNKGVACSEETKKKIGDANRGRPSKLKGRTLSEETKQKLSLVKKGKPSSRKGKHMSESARKKLSEAKSIKVKCVETGEIFASAKEAAAFVGTTAGAYLLQRSKLGQPYKGYHWEIISKETSSEKEE